MGIRNVVGRTIESGVGKERADVVRRRERELRSRLARRIAPPAPKAAHKPKNAAAKPAGPRWTPPDDYAEFAAPTISRHELLTGLHERLAPRTYFEIGVNTGESLALAQTHSIGVDPRLDRLTVAVSPQARLVSATSDDFFESAGAFDHFGGVPVDLAFIDGMHRSEYALRDFINTEKVMAPTGVVVLDDMLPRNDLEAARKRLTKAWAGDVFKVTEILRRHRPDLLVIPVNTSPTGTVVIVGMDPGSTVLDSVYDSEVEYCVRPDPQSVPAEFLKRTTAVDAQQLLACSAWTDLRAAREIGDTAAAGKARETLAQLPQGE